MENPKSKTKNETQNKAKRTKKNSSTYPGTF